jgi:hypothetical protein
MRASMSRRRWTWDTAGAREGPLGGCTRIEAHSGAWRGAAAERRCGDCANGDSEHPGRRCGDCVVRARVATL